MSEQEDTEEETPGTDLEALRGFIEFVAQSFYRASGEADYFAEGFRDLLRDRNDINENDKADIDFELGRLDYALYLLKQLYKDGPLGEYLDRPDVVKRFMKAISPVMELYLKIKAGSAEGVHNMLVTIGGATADIYNIIRDGLDEVENEE